MVLHNCGRVDSRRFKAKSPECNEELHSGLFFYACVGHEIFLTLILLNLTPSGSRKQKREGGKLYIPVI